MGCIRGSTSGYQVPVDERQAIKPGVVRPCFLAEKLKRGEEKAAEAAALVSDMSDKLRAMEAEAPVRRQIHDAKVDNEELRRVLEVEQARRREGTDRFPPPLSPVETISSPLRCVNLTPTAYILNTCTSNPKPETRNPKRKIQNPKP